MAASRQAMAAITAASRTKPSVSGMSGSRLGRSAPSGAHWIACRQLDRGQRDHEEGADQPGRAAPDHAPARQGNVTDQQSQRARDKKGNLGKCYSEIYGPSLRFAVINGMSANTGMRWDIEHTKKLIGYEPLDDVTRENSE